MMEQLSLFDIDELHPMIKLSNRKTKIYKNRGKLNETNFSFIVETINIADKLNSLTSDIFLGLKEYLEFGWKIDDKTLGVIKKSEFYWLVKRWISLED